MGFIDGLWNGLKVEFGKVYSNPFANAFNSINEAEGGKKLRVFDFDDTLVKTKSHIYITDKNGKSLKLSRSKKIDILELFHEYLILTGEGQNFPGGPYYHWDFVDSVDNYDDDESLKESIINWELHQKMMEKKYGKTKIKTKFDF